MATAQPTPNVSAKLEQWRSRLLDRSRSNRLLYFKTARSAILRLIAPDAPILFDGLVNEETTFTFRLPQADSIVNVEEPPDGSSGLQSRLPIAVETFEAPIRRPKPNEILAEVDPSKLAANLYRLRQRARASIEERGVNTLYMTFGLLDWKETSTSTETIQSPLLLVPVMLERETALDPYRLCRIDEEETILNPTLVEHLRDGFGLELTLPESEADLHLSDALDAVRAAIHRQSDWKVTDSVYLGHFSFLKLVMYKDLQIAAPLLERHPLVRALMGDLSALPEIPGDLPTEADLDAKVLPADSFYVLDADSSQLEALSAIDRGVNLIIQGPPGTGKSQTIANVIAQSIARQKRVLFVSEKKAALDVVHRRLIERGLDSFCLELHSYKANKRLVLDQLSRALNDADPGPPVRQLLSLEELARRRTRLNAYVEALHAPDTLLGFSAYHAHAEVARRREIPDLIFSYDGVALLTPSVLVNLTDLVGQFVAVGTVLVGQDKHPWRGTRVLRHSLLLEDGIRANFMEFREAIVELGTTTDRWTTAIGIGPTRHLEDARRLGSLLDLLVVNPSPQPDWFAAPSLDPLLALVRVWSKRCKDYHQRRASLLARYEPEFLQLDVMTLHELGNSLAKPALRHLRREGTEPEETEVNRRQEIDDALDRIITSLEALIEGAPELALLVGLETPATVPEARFLLSAVAFCLRDHRPCGEWLTRQQALLGQALVETARRHSAAIVMQEPQLFNDYDVAILGEAHVLSQRYRQNYATWLRVLSPGYWRDSGRLKSLSRMSRRPAPDEALTVLWNAQQVAEAHRWLEVHEAELLQTFGRHRAYSGATSDWDALSTALNTALDVLDEFPDASTSAEYVRVLSNGGPRLDSLRPLQSQISAALSDLDIALTKLSQIAKVIARPESLLSERIRAVKNWRAELNEFWAAETLIRGLQRSTTRSSLADKVADLAEAIVILDISTDVDQAAPQLSAVFGIFFNGLDTNWERINNALQWTESVRVHFAPRTVPKDFISKVTETFVRPSFQEASVYGQVIERVEEGLAYTSTIFDAAFFRPEDSTPDETTFSALIVWLDLRLGQMRGLQDWVDFARVCAQLSEAGLASFVSNLTSTPLPIDIWLDTFLKRVYRLWLDSRYQAVPALNEFRGIRHEQIVEEFRRLDRETIEIAPRRVRHQILSRRPAISLTAAWPSEPAILLNEIQKRKRHRPIRRLFRDIPKLLQTLKPCLLMSPLSVSQYLDSERIRFDIVIFDEASQVTPEDALGSIFRGTQIVVAGDQKQLPPTRFFERQLDDGDDEDEEDDGVLESILDQCAAIGMPSRPLRWHYRSKDERLIAFSNQYFYGGNLITFPSPDQTRPGFGIEFIHVPDGVYDRGATRKNRIEAQRIVELIVDHAEREPNRSLGVVAFSASQMEAINTELELTRRSRPDLESFFREDGHEPFFVKNLETVQGDERDVIFFSLGYAKDAAGKFIYNFGPLNQSGGERRLNVAVTRAREHVKFVSSIHPNDLEPERLASEGARLLRSYMDFAVNGPSALAAGAATIGGTADSDFEETVGIALAKRGLRIQRQVGCAGYRIDLAVVDGQHPGRYLLGIECDGATYHRSKTARDRDRLRQQVLEGLKWQIHRIWSQDWVRDPEQEIQRVLTALASARTAAVTEAAWDVRSVSPSGTELKLKGAPPPPEPADDIVPAGMPKQPRPASERVNLYPNARLPLQGDRDSFYGPHTPGRVIADLVARCVESEGPVHVDRVASAVALCWGFQRVGDRINKQIDLGISQAVRRKTVDLRGNFLWKAGTRTVAVRVPRVGARQRPIAEIDIEELVQAVLLVLEENFSLPRENLIVLTARLMQFDRVGPHVAERIDAAISLLDDRKQVGSLDGLVSWQVPS